MQHKEEAEARVAAARAMMTEQCGDHFHVIAAIDSTCSIWWGDRLDWWREAKAQAAEELGAEPRPTRVWITETANSKPCALCDETDVDVVLGMVLCAEPYWEDES